MPPQTTRRPGDRVVRRAIPTSETYRLKQPKVRRQSRNPAVVLVIGFAAMILIGTLLLSLPFVTESGERAGVIVALFTATSAVCVTGLVVVDTQNYWNTSGEAIILLLIQLGGIGFMASSTLLLLLMGRRARLRERLVLGEAMGTATPGNTLRLVRRIGLTTLVIEAIGALLLFPRFLEHRSSAAEAAWWSFFHSISAFNNAGIDLFGGFRSLTAYHDDYWIIGVVGLLILLGGISFLVMADIYEQRRWRRLSVDSKLVLSTTALLIVAGILLTLIFESSNPHTLKPLPVEEKIEDAIFFSIAPRTAGFSHIDLDLVRDETLFFSLPLMFIGGASGSTAGGIKIQTFALLFFAILATLRGREHASAFGREIGHIQVYRALSVALLAIAVVVLVALVLTLTEDQRFLDILFESVSAFATVGLSNGVTPELSIPGRLIIIVTMFIGRLGPLTLALALAARTSRENIRYATDTVRIG